ncbi:MAG: autotransporter-associated beta strand repeat-containing protein [Akkermansiaceae bacterium]|jgi:autotransporter-associated beta strand protein|nr:autotransporter-associated beta strand repeat-containing protein [Akkermansiaceae bacterium]
MKAIPRFVLRHPTLPVLLLVTCAQAADRTWDNGAATGNWNTTDVNWTGATWASGDNAIFTSSTGAVVLTEPVSATNFAFGTITANTTGSFSGSPLSVSGNLTVLADGNNGPGGPTVSFSNNVTVTGDLGIGRRVVEFTGGSVTVNRVLAASSWGRLLISGSAVTATNGIDDSINGGNTLSVVLFGGSLSTPYIKTTTASWTGLPNDGVVLSGGTLLPTASSTDFIQSHDPAGWGTRNNVGVGTGGANIDTNGFDITITKTMQDWAGSGPLTKSGAGTLTLTAANSYSGGTTVNAGSLVLDGAAGGNSRIAGPLTVNNGATVSLINDDGTGFGFNSGAKLTALTINGGTVTTSGTMHVWNLSGGITMTGGTLQSNNGTSDANGPQMEWINSDVTTFASADTATIGGRIRMRGDGGATGIIFTVADGAAATDLHVTAAITEAGPDRQVTKRGPGTMRFSGANNYTGVTIVEEGTLALSAPILDDTADLIIDAAGRMNLDFTGSDIVGSLEIDNSGPLPAGIYDSTHPTYGSYFSGTGSLVVPGSDGTWIALADGNWSDTLNWAGGTVAVGYDATATFNASTGVTVNVDSNRKIGNINFAVSNYTLAGSGSLTLDSSATPLIDVAGGTTSTISANLDGSFGMEKTGSGRLILSGVKSYAGGTFISGGVLEVSGGTAGVAQIHGSVLVSPGTTLSFTNGDGTGFGFFNNPVNSIVVDGGTINAVSGSHLGFGPFMTMSLENGGSLLGSWQWNGDGLLGFSSSGDITNTISGTVTLRSDAGSAHSFNVSDGLAATDLQINGNLGDQWPEYPSVPASGLTKVGPGTMVLNGTNTYDGNTSVTDGALNVGASGSLHFRPTTNGMTNSVSSTGTGSFSFLGSVSLDLGAADATDGNVWNLFNLPSFASAPDLSATLAVTSNLGAFTEVSSGTWELAVTGAKWIFTEANGNLSYETTATPYDTWGATYGLTAGSETGDLDSDGMTNFEEYAFGLIPNSGSSANPIAVPLDKTSGTFSYTRRQQSLTGLSYTIWTSTNLTTWTQDTGAAQGAPALNGEVETVPVTLSPALLANPRLFIQVRAE